MALIETSDTMNEVEMTDNLPKDFDPATTAVCFEAPQILLRHPDAVIRVNERGVVVQIGIKMSLVESLGLRDTTDKRGWYLQGEGSKR